MRLTDKEKKIRDGAKGDAAAMAMAILVELAEAVDATDLVEVSHVHTDSGFYLGDSGLEFVEHLAELKGKVAVPTSMNNTTFDIEKSSSYGVPQELREKIFRLERAHLQLGASPIWSCAPYQEDIVLDKGQMVAWSESNAIFYANSIYGARTNRTGDLVDICCALTGRAPRAGLYLDENRIAEFFVELEGFTQEFFNDECFYPLLGYAIGSKFGNKVAAVSGLPSSISGDGLKGLGAAAASSGATALLHLIGVTPEAKTKELCCNKETLKEKVVFQPSDIKDAEETLWTADSKEVDWIGLGCPHLSKNEFLELASLVQGKRIASNVEFTVFTSRSIRDLVEKFGVIETLSDAGIKVYSDGCLLTYPQFTRSSGTMMTNSVKGANYIFSQAGLKAAYGSIGECVESALTGKIVRRKSSWLL